jgi:general L-amino acid transport system substrate-binding protein
MVLGNRSCATAMMACLLYAAPAVAPSFAQGSGSATLDAVRARGEMQCGTAGTVAGFSLPDSEGIMHGLDADSCRAVGAAALGNVNKVNFVPTTTQNRFTVL